MRIGYDEALDLLDHEHDDKIVKAGEALSVLDEDTGQDEVKFFHQLVQEYFAGRRFAATRTASQSSGRRRWRKVREDEASLAVGQLRRTVERC